MPRRRPPPQDITAQGITAMPAAITAPGDPIAVFDYAATISPELAALSRPR